MTVDRDHGVTAPMGFRAAGVAAKIKSSGAPDLALVVNDGPDHAATGVFTRNQVKAAPVLWSQQVLVERRLRAVVLNSGGANACTGRGGLQDTHTTAERVAAALGIGAIDVAVCSTGLIGQRLPTGNLLSGVDAAAAELAATTDAGLAAANAVLTTDTVPKQAAVHHPDGWTMGGFAKGAGMMAPGLATMLVVLTTDARADGQVLDTALRAATRVSFDRLDIDGSMSTNDTVLLLGSGASGIAPSDEQLAHAATEVCVDLAAQLQADAEGVTKRIAITVEDASTEDDAVAVGRAVARDRLVATAMFGSDPNWGRILAAVGAGPVTVDPDAIDIAINGVTVARDGTAADARELVDLSGKQIDIVIRLHRGEARATVWTTDLSHGYVDENSAYPS